MPIIEMHLMEGRTPQQKKKAAVAMTKALAESLEVNEESVRILITEHDKAGFFVAGMSMDERAALLKNKIEEV